ncbi:MAG: hypothetical protein V3S46_08660 [Nitrospinota bacterium]
MKSFFRGLLLFTVVLIFFGYGTSFGTEIDFSDVRNPFKFGTSGTRALKKGDDTEKKIVQKGEYKVGLIMIKGSKKIVVINDKRYTEGDKVGKYLIESITLNHMEISDGTSSRRLEINEIFR